MVRFKNRHLLVEFLSPQSYQATFSPSESNTRPNTSNPNEPKFNDDDDDEEHDDDEDEIIQTPSIPFLLPLPDSTGLNIGKSSGNGNEGTNAIFKAIRACIQDVFGDEGWSRVASSFKVIYTSPQTTLTILRISRQHYRLLWTSITLLREIDKIPIVPRVIAVSGTIKKLQNRAIGYHRLITGLMISSMLSETRDSTGVRDTSTDTEIRQKMQEKFSKEITDIQSLED